MSMEDLTKTLPKDSDLQVMALIYLRPYRRGPGATALSGVDRAAQPKERIDAVIKLDAFVTTRPTRTLLS